MLTTHTSSSPTASRGTYDGRQQPHADQGWIPAAGGQALEESVFSGLCVQVERLVIQALRELDDLRRIQQMLAAR